MNFVLSHVCLLLIVAKTKNIVFYLKYSIPYVLWIAFFCLMKHNFDLKMIEILKQECIVTEIACVFHQKELSLCQKIEFSNSHIFAT